MAKRRRRLVNIIYQKLLFGMKWLNLLNVECKVDIRHIGYFIQLSFEDASIFVFVGIKNVNIVILCTFYSLKRGLWVRFIQPYHPHFACRKVQIMLVKILLHLLKMLCLRKLVRSMMRLPIFALPFMMYGYNSLYLIMFLNDGLIHA